MKRNMDLIRALLLKVESGHSQLSIHEVEDLATVDDIASKTVHYHMNLLVDADFIDASATHRGTWYIKSMTWAGHDFLDTVRDPEIWKRTKDVAKEAKGFSVELLRDIAKGLVKKQVKRLTDVDIEI